MITDNGAFWWQAFDRDISDLLLVLERLNPEWIHEVDDEGRIISKERH
jgi:hypothetical protein